MSRGVAICAITFDLDDTLWDVGVVIRRAEVKLHAWLARHHPPVADAYDPVALRALTQAVAADHPEQAFDRSFLRLEALRRAAEAIDHQPFCPHSAFEVFYRARNEVVFFDDVLPCLERLKGRYPLAALTNGNANIEQVGLGEVMDFAIAATDVGAPKPDPSMFIAACQRLDLEPAQVLHVGDDPELDVLAAAEVGMATAWVNRKGQSWPGRGAFDVELESLAALDEVLDDWR